MVALGLYLAAHALGHFREKMAAEVGHHQPHHLGAPGHQAARHPIRLIVQLLDAFQDAFARSVTDVGVVVKHLRYGNDRDTKIAGNVFQRCWHMISPKRLRLPHGFRALVRLAARYCRSRSRFSTLARNGDAPPTDKAARCHLRHVASTQTETIAAAECHSTTVPKTIK